MQLALLSQRLILSLPLEVLSSHIFAYIPVRPRLLAVSVVCKRFLVAARRSVTHLQFSDVSATLGELSCLSLFPSITELNLAGLPRHRIALPSTISRLELTLGTDDIPGIDWTGPASLTHLTLSALDSVSLVLTIYPHMDSLTHIGLNTSWETSLTAFLACFHFPSLCSVSFAASVMLYSSEPYKNVHSFLARHSSQLLSITLKPQIPEGELLAGITFPRLRELVLLHRCPSLETLTSILEHSSNLTELTLCGDSGIDEVDTIPRLLTSLVDLHDARISFDIFDSASHTVRFPRLRGITPSAPTLFTGIAVLYQALLCRVTVLSFSQGDSTEQIWRVLSSGDATNVRELQLGCACPEEHELLLRLPKLEYLEFHGMSLSIGEITRTIRTFIHSCQSLLAINVWVESVISGDEEEKDVLRLTELRELVRDAYRGGIRGLSFTVQASSTTSKYKNLLELESVDGIDWRYGWLRVSVFYRKEREALA